MAHFHICWIKQDKEKMDYLGIVSRAEAQNMAERLQRPGERFKIVKFATDECSSSCYDPKLLRKGLPSTSTRKPQHQSTGRK